MADFYNNEFTFQNPKQKKHNELTQEQNQIDTQVNSNRESKYQDVIQEREQRAINQNKYGVDIPDEVYQVLNNGIANSDIPEETAYNIASAYKYSEMYGVPVEMAMENLESFNSLTFGSKQQATPKGNFEAICNSWQIGKNTLTMANLAASLREAEKNEDATLIANIEQQLALLESENNNLQDYQNRNFFIQSLKDGAQTLPYSGAVAIPGILNAFLPGLGTAAAGITSAELSSRLEYLNLRKSGATPEVARNVSSLSGIVQGATEMALGTVAKSLGTDKLGQVIGNKADDVVKAVLNKMHINSLGFSKVASAMVNYGLDATGEGVEEALQEFESFLGVVIAEKIQDEADGKIQVPEIQEMVNSAVQSFSAGFRSSLVLGGLANIPQGIASIQDAKAVKEAAQTIPSKEDFIKTTADSPIFEGMSDEKRKETQEEIYNSFEKQRSEILDSKAKDIDEVSDFQAGSEDNKIQEAEDTEEEVRGAAYRENGRLYTETDVTTDESGTVKGTFKIGNPTEETSYNRYGYINFTEGKDNTITIENFKLTPGRQNLAVEMFEEFSEQFSDKNIIWKPKGKTGKALYKQLALNNPRGKNYGLSYFTENDTATIKDRHARLKLAKDMQSYFPNMSSAERATGVAIFESMAKSMGMGLDDYIQNTYRDGNVFADFSETGESATVIENGQKFFRKGAMTTFANDAKSIIYTTQHSDFSTFVHENAHVYRAHMTKELLEQAEKAFGVVDGDWNAKNYKTADGRTISYEEAFAEGFEDYLRTGQAKDSALKQIYDKIAQFMARIYNWMKNEARIEISPEIKNIYDQMVSGESSLAEAIAVTQKVDEQQREAYLAEQKQKQGQQKETEQKIFNEESTAEEIKDAKVEDVINSDTVAEDVKVEKILETVTDEQAEKELENINTDDIPIFQTITGEGLERLLRNNAKMQEALEKAKTFSNHGYSFEEFKTGDFVFRKIANKWAIETDDKKAYLGRKTVFDGIKKASNIKFSAMYQAALAKAQGNTEVAKEFVKSSNLIGTTLERNRFTLDDVLGYEELYTAYPWMKTIPVKFVSVANKNLVNITENEIEINPFAGTFEELGPALLEKTQEILNKHQGISADTDIFNEKQDTALKSLIDKATLINREFRNYNDFIDASYEEVKDDLNYQIIGEIGAKALDVAEEATIRLDNLSIARQMEEQGKDALTIRLATGWEKGVDEQWRYEIDDTKFNSDFEYKDIEFLKNNPRYEELEKKMFNGTNYDWNNLSEEEQREYDELSDLHYEGYLKDEATLPEILDAPELFNAYPQLKKLVVKFSDKPGLVAGQYKKGKIIDTLFEIEEDYNQIDIFTLPNSENAEKIKSTLLHEIQHAIQRIEGFAKGGNIDQFAEQIKRKNPLTPAQEKLVNDVDLYNRNVQDKSKFTLLDFMKGQIQFDNAEGIYDDDFIKSYLLSEDDILYAYNQAKPKLEKYRTDLKNEKSPYDSYLSLAGEVEARNVQNRMYMTSDERRKKLLQDTADVAALDQIILHQTDYASVMQEWEEEENKQNEILFQEEIEAIREQYENTDKWLKAPNGNDTNLTEKQWLQVRTPQFKEWFGDWENDPENASKVVDENGEPLVVYHFTDANFDVFDIKQARSQSDIQAFFFSSGSSDWQDMGENTFGVYLNLRNPSKKPIVKQSENNAGIKAREDLQAKGYDGTIEIEEGMETEYTVFSPNQIKSATDNSGEFSADNPSILFQTAYHGSPHNFDNFSTSAIGTGEGAQAFGWGLYFTNQEDIARWYADKLANEPLRLTLSSKKDFLKTRKKSLKDVENKEKYEARIYKNIKHFDKELKQAKKEKDQSQVDFYQKLIDESFEQLDETYRISLIDSFKKDIEVINNEISELKKSMKNNRNLYTVELPDNGYLLWDKIYKEEIPAIMKALREEIEKDYSSGDAYIEWDLLEELESNNFTLSGKYLYDNVSRLFYGANKEKLASKYLRRIGYVGIDYPADSFSGNTDEGKRNYVIFDEADINVIEHINYQDVPEEFLDSVNDATLKEAASFESWQDFMEYYETDYVPKNIDIPQDVTAGWYQRTWELAHNLKPSESINREEYLAEELAAGDTALVDDALFMTELSGESNMLIPFLKAINYYKTAQEWQPQDAEDEQELERFRRIKNRVEYEIRHASILTNALRVAQGKPLTDKARRTLLSLIQANVRDYRALYADIMYEDRFAVNLADTNKGKVKIANPNMDVDTMSPEQLKEIADKIEFEELANKIKKGELLMDDEINRYINMLETQIKASDKKVKEAQKALEDEKLETSQDYKRISDWQQRQLLKYYDELLEAKGKLYEKDKRNLKKAEKGLKIAEPYQLDRNRRQSNYDTIFRQFQDMKKITEITGEVKEAMAHRDALYEAKLENTKLREAATALSETREIQKKLVKRAMRKIDFKTVDYEQAVKIIAIQETFEPLLLDGLNQWIDTDNPYLRTVYYDFKTDPEFAQKLEERSERKGGKNLRYLINLIKTKDIEEWTVDEKKKARQSLPRNDYIREFGIENLGRYRKGSLQLDLQSPEIQKMLKDTLSIDLYAAISGKPFVKWTITEMAELAELIGDLYAEGKSMLRAKQEAKKQEATRIRAKIEEAIRTGGIEIPDDAPEEEKEKYRKLIDKRTQQILGYESVVQGTLDAQNNKNSLFNRLRHRGYADATVLRVARLLDGDKEGTNVDLLYYRADESYNSKHKNIRKRQAKIDKALIDNNIKVEELYKQITLGNFYKNGKSATFTVDELLFFAAADKDRPPENTENNFDGGTAYEAVVYGNMASPQEKEAIRQSLMDVTLSDDDLGLVQAQYKGMCEARFERIMQLVKTLDPKFLKFAEAIADDYEKEFERMNKASIEEFNQPVWRVKKYIPLIRLGQTGEENENRVKEDLLGTSGIQNQNWVNKGMTQKRIKINPWNQRPVEIGLYKTWLDAVDRTEHFIAYSGYVRSLNRVYKSRDANGNRALMEAMFGKGMVRYIDDYINELANPTPTAQRTSLDKICRTLRGKTAPAYLAWKLSGIIKQFITSPWPFYQFINPVEYIKASMSFMKDPNNMSEAIKSKSVFMAKRTMDPVIDLIKEQQLKATNKAKAGLNEFNSTGMKGLELVDWLCVAPGWLAVYEKEYNKLTSEIANQEKARENAYKNKLDQLIEENEKLEYFAQKSMEELQEEAKMDLPHVNTTEEIEELAVRKADDYTRRCQPSSRAEDLSPLFKNSGKNSELVKILLQFQTSLNVIWNNIRYDLPQAVKEKQYKQAISIVASYAMAGITVILVTGGPYGDEEDDDKTKLAKKIMFGAVTQFTDSVPVLGSYITTLSEMLITGEGGMMYSNNTFPVLNEAMGTVQSAIKGDWDKAAINFGEGVGYFLGLPVSGTKELLESAGLRDDEKGAEFNPGAFLGWRE